MRRIIYREREGCLNATRIGDNSGPKSRRKCSVRNQAPREPVASSLGQPWIYVRSVGFSRSANNQGTEFRTGQSGTS
jgi:hypothetical protein